jgi:hypothetical protein
MKKYSADFETATWLDNETYVWAWAVCEIGNEENIVIDNSIETFMKFLEKSNNATFYFHNLKFDGEFIIYWLFKNGFSHIINKNQRKDKTFTTLISDLGMFYQINIYFKASKNYTKKVTIIDSLKMLPFSVDMIAKSFGLPISKLELDYDEVREKGHLITLHERDYITNDVVIVAKALDILFHENLTKMTIGSNALHDFKDIITLNRFNHLFTKLNYKLDEELRKAYKGGFTYLNPKWKEKDTGKGITLDVNSLYPSCMLKMLPFGDPHYYIGEYKEDSVYPLYIQKISCSFEIKKNMIPTIQIKNGYNYKPNEYITSSNGEIEVLIMTSIDLKLFLEHYEVFDLHYIEGWKFKAIRGIFDDYINKWTQRKIQATIEKNKGQRTLAKLMLNSLYGKFATSMNIQSKICYLGEDDIVHYKLTEKETKDGLYLPIACFITAYAREVTIRTSQKITDYSLKKYGEDKYIYSDTDSISTTLSIEEVKQFCEIDDTALGKWAHENTFDNGKFIRQKTYLKLIDNEIHITCAGMPKTCYDFVTWENFKEGFTCGGKLIYKHVIGGVKLVETDFTIKEDKNLTKNIKAFKI